MGSHKDRSRRPFIWQDQMAEVKNLFRKVAKVKSSGFTGFSVWKDEPTAEMLSKNRLRRRRAQYALDLTHLNYSESPYESLNHLHNIRGMCSRIQRQDLYVERKKKDYDAGIHPSLIRRPVSAFACNAAWDDGDRAGLRHRPSSAPYSMGTPLHYTAPKPTLLYDATHRYPCYRSFTKRPSSSLSSSRSGRSVQSVRAATCDSSALSSTANSTPVPSSTRNQTGSPSTSASYRLNTEYALKQDVPSSRCPRTTTTEVEVSASDLYSSDVEPGSQDLSSSVLSMDQRPSSRFTAHERPPSRPLRKRPPRYKEQQVENKKVERRNDFVSASASTHKGHRSTPAGVPDSPSSTITDDVLISNSTRPLSSRKDKVKLSDRNCGLWALKQHSPRPRTADYVSLGRAEDQKQRPTIASSYPNANAFSSSSPAHVKVRISCGIPEANKNTGKRDNTPTVDGCIDHSDESCSETEYSMRTESKLLPTSAHARNSGELQASSSTDANEAHTTASTAACDDSHVLIKHSTDPYADFKTSMMHMINEEGLIDKQWELEELFQYYMDLNPVVHHDILRRVINDIRKDLAAEKVSR